MIIDYTKNFSSENIKNIHALDYMKEWLFTLANNMYTYEEQAKSNPLMEWCQLYMWEKITWVSRNALTCLYMWFTNTMVNYVELVWTLAIMQEKWWLIEDIKENSKEIKKFTRKYAEEVIPEVYKWRNKVFAHFSFTAPYNEDNLGLLKHSITIPVSWSDWKYKIWTFQTWHGDEVSDLPEWSINEVFEELIPRYWPDITKGNNK